MTRARAVTRTWPPPRAPPDLAALCASAVQRLVPVPQPDDIALLLTRTHALGADHVVVWDVPVDPAAVADVRARATRQIAAWGLDELSMTTELIVSELVTNAIRYAAPPIRLRLLRDTWLTCEVADASSAAPRLRHARTTDEGAAACSWWPSWPTAGAPATPPTARSSGPSRRSRRPRAE
ncbi:hypothetical protein GCM10020295_16780 [Streptomyces cinereospinus]